MTLTRKRQTVFPLDWCREQGLAKGGPLNVFDLGDAGLLVRPVKPPSAREIQRLLAQTPAGKHSRKEAAEIIKKALQKARGR